MDKRLIIVVLLILVILWMTNKATAQTTKPTLDDADIKGTPDNGDQKNLFVSSGDTWYKIVFSNWDFINAPFEKTKENVLAVTKLEAEKNGFNWDLYDDKPTKNAVDPDYLLPGQKLVLFNWASLSESPQMAVKTYDAFHSVSLGNPSFN